MYQHLLRNAFHHGVIYTLTARLDFQLRIEYIKITNVSAPNLVVDAIRTMPTNHSSSYSSFPPGSQLPHVHYNYNLWWYALGRYTSAYALRARHSCLSIEPNINRITLTNNLSQCHSIKSPTRGHKWQIIRRKKKNKNIRIFSLHFFCIFRYDNDECWPITCLPPLHYNVRRGIASFLPVGHVHLFRIFSKVFHSWYTRLFNFFQWL